MWGGKTSESKSEGKHSDDLGGSDCKGGRDAKQEPVPQVDIRDIVIVGSSAEITAPLELKIKFDLDRDVLAAFWIVKLLVDSCDKRLIKILGETAVDDYTEGDNEMYFSVEGIDVSDIAPSVLANYGLLMACLMVDGEEVATVNMVVNVTKSDGKIIREILSPLE